MLKLQKLIKKTGEFIKNMENKRRLEEEEKKKTA